MSSERAGVHTSGALNREKFVELLMDKHIPVDDVLDALEACVVPDPRVARIEAELDHLEKVNAYAEDETFAGVYFATNRVRAILRGEQ